MRATAVRRTSFPAILIILLTLSLSLYQCSEEDTVSSTLNSEWLGQGTYEGEYFPTEDWRVCHPSEVGLSVSRLVRALEYAADSSFDTQACLVIRQGYIVAEMYLNRFRQTDRHYSYSVAKSFTSALVGIALNSGEIDSLDQPVFEFFPQWQLPGTDPLKQQITIRHLLTMTSGLEWNESDYTDSNIDPYVMHRQYDAVKYVLDKPMDTIPGDRWYYSTGDSQLLAGVISAATEFDVGDYARSRLFEPIGIGDVVWDQDQAGNAYTGSGIRATAREFAKFGYLYLNNGNWDGNQVVPREWVTLTTRSFRNDIPFYGYQWWMKVALTGGSYSNIPSGTYLAWGIHGQQVMVVPVLDLLVVRLAADPEGPNAIWNGAELLSRVVNAVVR